MDCIEKEFPMMDSEDRRLSHLQECELILAEELKRICELYHLKYFLVAGSMLGAVRHQGFIPWDDDMDFGMPRADYEEFLKMCKKELGSSYKITNWEEDTDFPFSYSKLVLKDTSIREEFSPKDLKNNGIFIDIFPFDKAPDTKVEQRKQARRIFYLRRALWLKKGYGRVITSHGVKNALKYYLSRIMVVFLPYALLKSCFSKTIKKYNKTNCNKMAMDCQYPYTKNIIDKHWMDNLVLYDFSGKLFPGFRDYDPYLKRIYGDYLELPKKEDRMNHGILEIDFGSY